MTLLMVACAGVLLTTPLAFRYNRWVWGLVLLVSSCLALDVVLVLALVAGYAITAAFLVVQGLMHGFAFALWRRRTAFSHKGLR